MTGSTMLGTPYMLGTPMPRLPHLNPLEGWELIVADEAGSMYRGRVQLHERVYENGTSTTFRFYENEVRGSQHTIPPPRARARAASHAPPCTRYKVHNPQYPTPRPRARASSLIRTAMYICTLALGARAHPMLVFGNQQPRCLFFFLPHPSAAQTRTIPPSPTSSSPSTRYWPLP